jgi:hypothetical protein
MNEISDRDRLYDAVREALGSGMKPSDVEKLVADAIKDHRCALVNVFGGERSA